jgi:dihydrofolate reductase
VEEVLRLKELPGKNISVDSIMIFQELLQHDLIDEFWLVVHPLICPEGKRLFIDQEKRLDFTLDGTRTFSSGVVALHYIRKK